MTGYPAPTLARPFGNAQALAIAGLPTPMYACIVAIRYAGAVMLGPFTLLRLAIGIVGDVIIFRELPDSFSGLGAALILASCVLSSRASTPRRPNRGNRPSARRPRREDWLRPAHPLKLS